MIFVGTICLILHRYSSSEIRFNLLAVVPDRLSRLKNALQNSEDSKKEEIEKLIREESEQRLNDEVLHNRLHLSFCFILFRMKTNGEKRNI